VAHTDQLTSQLNVLQVQVNEHFETLIAKFEALQLRVARLEARSPYSLGTTATSGSSQAERPPPDSATTLEPTVPFTQRVISGSRRDRHPNEDYLIVELQASGRACYTLLVYYNNTRGPHDSAARVIYDIETGELRAFNTRANLILTQYSVPPPGNYDFYTYSQFLLRTLHLDQVITAIWNTTHDAPA
jgi:hypothetical protein